MMEAQNNHQEQLLSPSASAETSRDALPPPHAAAEVSPGEGAFSPPNEFSPPNDDVDQDHHRGGHGEEVDVGFGPPPAFPTSRNSPPLGKRKRTLMAVSSPTGGGGAPLEEMMDSSEEDDEEGSGSRSQVIHRIKSGETPAKSPTDDDEEGAMAAKKYNDAMLLASLSDVDSPKRQEEFAAMEAAKNNNGARAPQLAPVLELPRQEQTRSPRSSGTPSTASTPLRSNVNPNPPPPAETVVKPFALMPKPQPHQGGSGYPPNKRPKSSPTAMTAAPLSPDGRDPKAVRPKNDRGGTREGVNMNVYAPHPSHPGQVGSAYPPYGGHPGYGYGYPGQPGAHPGGSPHGGHPGGPPPGYPPGYNPYYPSPYSQGGPPPPHGSGGPPPPGYPGYPPRAYGHPGYPPHPQDPRAPPQAHAPGSSGSVVSQGAPSPDRWGAYYSPKSQGMRGGAPPGAAPTGPEPVRSNPVPVAAPYHPLSGGSSSGSQSHVVPSEDGGDVEGSPYGRGPPPGYGPPPPGYDARYGPPPPGTTDPYGRPVVPPAPSPRELPSISRDEGTPPRTPARPRPRSGGEYLAPEYCTPASTSAGSPPRSSAPYDYYSPEAQGAAPPPGSHHGGYPPQGYAHPDSPVRSSASYPPHPYGPPLGAPHDPYEPFDYASAPSPANESHYHVPAAVSNETDPSQPHGPPPPSSAGRSQSSYHQFRKGGRSVRSEPVVLRKKFSWRNYPELEEYLIANRTDYLRHSALNYTAEQKHFNNRLTEGLLELAAKLNYVFDETCFNFVAVRDRIRCYYKSYVQSSKKRGVVVGFSKSGVKNEVSGEA